MRAIRSAELLAVALAVSGASCTGVAPTPSQAHPTPNAPPSQPPAPPASALAVSWSEAAAHTTQGRAAFVQSLHTTDPAEQRKVVGGSITEYQQAAAAWRGVLPDAAERAEEAAYWLADAEYWVVCLKCAVDLRVTAEETSTAVRDARLVVATKRGSGRYRQAAAYDLVSLADKVLDLTEFHSHTSSRMSPEAWLAVRARDEYVAAQIQPSAEPSIKQIGPPGDLEARYGYEAAALLLSHGNPLDAAERFRRVRDAQCDRTDWGERARQQLLALPSATVGDVSSKACVLTGKE